MICPEFFRDVISLNEMKELMELNTNHESRHHG